MPRRRTKTSKRNPLLDMPADQVWNTRGSVIWSNKIVVCPRCGKESRLTLAASLRSDWDLSLTCCPLPVTRRRPPATKDVPPPVPQPNGSEAPPASTEPAAAESEESQDASESEEGSEPPPPEQQRYQRRDQPHDTTEEGEAPAA